MFTEQWRAPLPSVHLLVSPWEEPDEVEEIFAVILFKLHQVIDAFYFCK